MGSNILAIKRVIIDLVNKTAMISSYQVINSVITRSRGYAIQKKVLVDRLLIIPFISKALI